MKYKNLSVREVLEKNRLVLERQSKPVIPDRSYRNDIDSITPTLNDTENKDIEYNKYFYEFKKLLVKKLQIDGNQISLNSSIFGDLGADSLDSVELVMDMEEHFIIEILDEEAEKCRTVKDCVDLIYRKKLEDRIYD